MVIYPSNFDTFRKVASLSGASTSPEHPAQPDQSARWGEGHLAIIKPGPGPTPSPKATQDETKGHAMISNADRHSAPISDGPSIEIPSEIISTQHQYSAVNKLKIDGLSSRRFRVILMSYIKENYSSMFTKEGGHERVS